jgi:hypothetical protein
MSFELERTLRETLQREEPAAAFTERLLARIAAEEGASAPSQAETVRENRWQQFLKLFQLPALHWATAGALACLLLVGALGVQRYREQQREIAEGERAKEQVMLALRIASSKLNTAQRKVRETSERGAGKHATRAE